MRLRRSPAKADEARHCVERERCPDETAPASRGVFTAIAVRLGTHPHASNVPEVPLRIAWEMASPSAGRPCAEYAARI